MREARTYIIRIYRQGYRSLSGIVEDAYTGSKRPFLNTTELVALLRAPVVDASSVKHRGKSSPR
jgi:hypothetical protein